MIQVMNSGVHLHDDKIKGKQKEKLCCSMMVIDNWHKWNNKNQAHWVTQKQFYSSPIIVSFIMNYWVWKKKKTLAMDPLFSKYIPFLPLIISFFLRSILLLLSRIFFFWNYIYLFWKMYLSKYDSLTESLVVDLTFSINKLRNLFETIWNWRE